VSLTIELTDMMLPGVSDVILNKDDDLIFLTVGMYKLFLSKAGGRDARDLYLHLMFTARMQETNQVWANKTYLKKGLSLGDTRLKRAKALLKKLGLIEYVQPRKKGKVEKVYIRLTKLWSWQTIARAAGSVFEPAAKSPFLPQGRFTAPPVRGPLNALSEKVNKRVEQPSAEEKPTASPSLAKSKGPRTPHGRLRVLFCELYRMKYGVARAPFNAACAGQLRNDLERLGEEKLARCLRFLFDRPPARMKSFAYMALHTFLPEAEKALESEERQLRLLKTCRACGKASETTGIDCPKCGEPDAYQAREAHRA
jgi:hypothetical protein